MIVIENVETYGWEAAVRGMRNPMNSWASSDSCKCDDDCPMVDKGFTPVECVGNSYCIGERDYKLMHHLAKSGTDHRKFMRFISVTMDITAPMYWWSQFDTYKVGTVANSCSKMHKIHAKEFEVDDFSHEQLNADGMDALKVLVDKLNDARVYYNETKDKTYWWMMIQLLPASYNQRRTVMLNYEVLHKMYHARKNHKLDEWHSFCEMVERMPYSQLITDDAGK